MVHANTMAEWRLEWWNGWLAGTVEWQEWREWREWREWQKEWQNKSGYILLFMVHADTDTDDNNDDT